MRRGIFHRDRPKRATHSFFAIIHLCRLERTSVRPNVGASLEGINDIGFAGGNPLSLFFIAKLHLEKQILSSAEESPHVGGSRKIYFDKVIGVHYKCHL